MKPINFKQQELIPVSIDVLRNYMRPLCPVKIGINTNTENIFNLTFDPEDQFILYIDEKGIPSFLEQFNENKTQVFILNLDQVCLEYLISTFKPLINDEDIKLN